MSKCHLFECWERKGAGREDRRAHATLLVSAGIGPDREVRAFGLMMGRK